MTWTQEQAIDLCKKIHAACPLHGCHVALTGGCLYKDGERKDLDLVFYRIRQTDIDIVGLERSLAALGVQVTQHFGWLSKAEYEGKSLDLMFPEIVDGLYYPDDAKDRVQVPFMLTELVPL